MVAVNAARADFADDDGLPRPAVLADFLEFLRQTLRHGRVVVPLTRLPGRSKSAAVIGRDASKSCRSA